VQIAYADGIEMCYGVTFLDDRWNATGEDYDEFNVAVLAAE